MMVSMTSKAAGLQMASLIECIPAIGTGQDFNRDVKMQASVVPDNVEQVNAMTGKRN